MGSENLHKDLPENLPGGSSKELPDTNKNKLRRLLGIVSKQIKSGVSTLKTKLKSASKAVLNAPKGWLNTGKVKSQRLLKTLFKLPKSTLPRLKPALKSVLKSVLYTIKSKVRRLVDAKSSFSKWFDLHKDTLKKVRRGVIIWVISVALISMAVAVTNFIIEKQQAVEQRTSQLKRQLEATIEEKTVLEKKLEEMARLKEDLAERLEAQRPINKLLGWLEPETERPEAKIAEELVPVRAAEETKKVTSALDEEKPKRPLVFEKIYPKPSFFKKPTLAIILAIAFVVGVTLLCSFGSRFQLLREPIKRAIAIVAKERVAEGQISKFKRLEDISSTLLGGLLLKGFVKMGYEVSLTSGIISGRLTCVLKRENEKILFRYIICKEEDDFGRAFVKDLAKSIKKEKADKGYLVTTGAVTEPVLALAKKNSIKLVGRETLEELIPSCLLQESLMKKLDDTKTEFIKQSKIAKNVMAQKQTLSEKIRGYEGMITKLNNEKTALSEKAETKEERSQLLQEKVQGLEEQLANYKNLKEQLSEKNKLLEDERSQRQRLEDKLRQSDKDLEQALDLTDELEEKLVQKEHELLKKEIALEGLSAGISKEAVNKEEFEKLKADHKILQQSLAEKEEVLEEINKKKGILDEELKTKDELLSKLQNEVQNYVTEMEEAISPSLDLGPLADKGVLLKLEPTGPVAAVKRIAVSGVSFESERKLEIPSSCNTTLIFFGSSNPLTVRSNLIWQKKSPGSSVYNIRFKFLSLEQSQRRRIHEYISKTRKASSKVRTYV